MTESVPWLPGAMHPGRWRVMTPNSTPDLTDALAAVRASLQSYSPPRLAEPLWAAIRDEAVTLVLRAGPLTEERTRKDMQLVADVAAHLSHTHTELTLDNLLADTTLASYDAAQAATGMTAKTLENKRGRFRRLQAAHRQVPWRKARRSDGERIASLVQPEVVETVAGLLPPDGVSGRRGASALQAALDDARRRRRQTDGPELEPTVWAAARAFARTADVSITKRELDAVATFEVLAEPGPVSSLTATYGLTRRDMDLALTLAEGLPEQPSVEHAALLRG